jgi:hypothetical protein
MAASAAWFEVDREGLAKLQGRRGPSFVVFELIQNGLDQNVTRVDVTLEPIAGRALGRLVVEDDDPEGFADLSHAFTLFAESAKKGDPEKRGRFNLGEKLVLAMCEEASIATTKGTVRFDGGGRSELRARRDRGSCFEGLVRMSRQELADISAAVGRIIPPASVMLRFNGVALEPRKPLAVFSATLDTEIAGGDGLLRRSPRRTEVRVYEPRPVARCHVVALHVQRDFLLYVVVPPVSRFHYREPQLVDAGHFCARSAQRFSTRSTIASSMAPSPGCGTPWAAATCSRRRCATSYRGALGRRSSTIPPIHQRTGWRPRRGTR